jgi:hypothetical protein
MSDEMKPMAWCNPLEAYADSYAQMSRDGDGRVDCRSVEVDIRQNMMPVVAALVAERDDLKKRDDEWLAKTEWAQELGGAFPEAAGLHRADVMVAALLALKGRLAKNATLEAERDAYRDMAARKSTEKVAEFHRANSAERERDEAWERLRSANAPMECDFDKITAAENVLAWLVVEKLGCIDDRTYSPNEAQAIIEGAVDRATTAETALADARAEVEQLRLALERITKHPIHSAVAGRRDIGLPGFPSCQDIARAALEASDDPRP